ncbi:hypothetical protein E5C26_16960 [Serratia proteamaculans]|uniref:hypothetical protein n=1 Tax=Serratia proteamaculans TaxID=28151 RepID=UPI0010761C4F|nr:hypothetical protein [Serratia proteamaculans]TFZ49714.1 hypothetical protein E5C26_16960 [Serratia proteamaculans]
MKWTNRVITGLVIVLFIFLALLLMIAIYYNSDKKMDLANSIIAISNAIMALSASYATYKAKDWLKAQTKTKGLEAAIEKISKLDEQYSDAIDSKERITKFSSDMDELKNSSSFENPILDLYIEQAKIEVGKLKQAKALAIRLQREILSIERLGINIAERNKIKVICNCLIDFYKISETFVLTTQYCLQAKHSEPKYLLYKIKFSELDFFSNEKKPILKELHSNKDKIYQDLDSYYDELMTVKVHEIFR